MSSEDESELQDANQSKVRIKNFKGRKALVKEVLHPQIPLLRRLEWWMLSREARTLKNLQELTCVPDFLGFPDRYSFAMEFKEGVTLREIDPSELPDSFFKELAKAVENIHELNIVHSDLKRRENIMVTPDDSPILIDFGAAFREKSGFHPLNNWVYEQFRQIDNNAVAKYKQRYCEHLLSEEEKERLNKPVFLEKLSRFGRKYILFRG